MRRARGILVATILALLACSDPTDGDATRTLDRVHGLSLPADAVQTSFEGDDLRAYSLSAQWDFETALTWDDYSALLQARLTPEFETRDAGPRAARFVRRLPGDVYELSVDSEPSQRGLHVRVRFVASAF